MADALRLASNTVKARLFDAPRDTKLAVSALLSYEVPEATRPGFIKPKGWDGRSTFFDFTSGTFPAGFVPIVDRELKRLGHRTLLASRPLPAPLGPELGTFDPMGFGFSERYDYQIETVRRLLRHGRMIARVATGGGKCLGRDTPVLMFDGSVKAVQDVQVGDQLMGPDSLPRNVLSTTAGVGPLYRVTPTKGDSYVVNDAHVLSLKTTTIHGKPKGRVVNVNVEEFLRQGSNFRHTHKGWRTGVEFTASDRPAVDPYFLGLLLGDGTIGGLVGLTTADPEMVAEVERQGFAWGLKVMRYAKDDSESKAASYYLTAGRTGPVGNPLMLALRELGLGAGEKFIPRSYLTASRAERLGLLAGIVDTDGHYDGKGFYLTLKSERLLDDVVFLARSLGFAAYKKAVVKRCCNNGVEGTYFTTVISGDLDLIPVRLERRRAAPRLQKKDPLVTGLRVEAIGEGEYFGFAVDSDHLFLLGDFTVTHNSNVCALAISTLRLPTLFLTTRSVLMYQMKGHLERAGFTPGVLGDGIWAPRKGVNVGMVQTLIARLAEGHPEREKTLSLLKYFRLVIGEEAHEVGGSSYYDILKNCTEADYRLALTATPFMRGDEEANMRLMAAFGPIGITVSEKMLIDRGILAQPLFKFLDAPSPSMLRIGTRWPTCYELGVVENEARNKLVTSELVRAVSHGLTGIALIGRKNHGHKLVSMLQESGVRSTFLFGDHDQAERREALSALGSGSLDVLVGSTILDVGVDVPSVGMIALAGGGKAEVATRQRIGRGLREKKKGPNICHVIDFNDSGNRILREHALMRRAIIEGTEGFSEGVLPVGRDFDYAVFKED